MTRIASINSGILAMFLFLSCINLCGAPLTECPYHLSGTITDTDTQQPLQAVYVNILEIQRSTLTDSTGHYHFAQLCAGNYTIVCSHVACQDMVQAIVLRQDTVVHFGMPHQNSLLKEIRISSQSDAHEIRQATLSQQEFDQRKNQTLAQALSNIAGVSSLQTGNNIAKPIIHGLHSQRLLLLNNGVRQEGQQWGAEHAPEIDILANDKISVITGAETVRYGSDAIAGAIITEANPLPISPKLSGNALIMSNSNGFGGTLALKMEAAIKPLPRWAWRVQGTWQRSGNSKTPNYYLDNTAIHNYHFNYNIGYRGSNYQTDLYYSQYNSQLGVFSGSHIGNLTDLQTAFAAERPFTKDTFYYNINRPKQTIEHELLRWKHNYQHKYWGEFQLLAAYQFNRRSEFDIHRNSNSSDENDNLPDMQLVCQTLTADIYWKQRPQKHWNATAGIGFLQQANDYSGRKFVPPSNHQNIGIFFTEHYQYRQWQLEAGVRFDYKNMYIDNTTDTALYFNNMAASTAVRYNLSPNTQLNYQCATTWRPPHPSELYSNGVHHGAAAYEIGKPDLKTERSIYQSLGIQHETEDKVKLDWNVYYNYMPTFIFLQPSPNTILTVVGAFPVFEYQQTKASLLGTDLSIQYKIATHWQLTQKASYLYAYNHQLHDYLIGMPPTQLNSAIQYNFGNSSKRFNTYLQLSMTHVSEQKHAPANQDFVPPPKGYTLLNAYAATTLVQKHHTIKLTANVTNLLNTTYRSYLNRFRYYADEIGSNVNIGATLSW